MKAEEIRRITAANLAKLTPPEIDAFDDSHWEGIRLQSYSTPATEEERQQFYKEFLGVGGAHKLNIMLDYIRS
jgi:hypothetical protein